MTVDITLPSGAELKITMAPFVEAKALYQAMMEEAKDIRIRPDDPMIELTKNVMCSALSSKRVESCLNKCMEKAIYKGQPCSKERTFEPVEAREDYIQVCYEVAKVNVNPFMKDLSARFSHLLEMLGNNQGSNSQTIPS